jgi:hypothetical protein
MSSAAQSGQLLAFDGRPAIRLGRNVRHAGPRTASSPSPPPRAAAASALRSSDRDDVGTDAALLADALDLDETAFKIELPSPSQPQPPRTAPAPNPPTYATTFAASGVSVSSLTLQLTASTTIYDASATVEVPLDADVPSWRSTRSQIIEDAMAGDHVWTSPFKASSSPLIESVPAPTAASFEAPATPPPLPQPQRNDWVVSGGSPSAAADYSPGDFVIVHLPSTLTSHQDDDSSTMQMVDALVSEARAAEIATRPAVWPTQWHADDDAQTRLPRHASDSGLLLPPHAHTGVGVDAAAFEHILGDTTGLTAAAEATGSMWSIDPSIPVVFRPVRDKATIEYSDPVASVPMTDGRPAFVALQEPTRGDAPAPTYLPAPTVAQKSLLSIRRDFARSHSSTAVGSRAATHFGGTTADASAEHPRGRTRRLGQATAMEVRLAAGRRPDVRCGARRTRIESCAASHRRWCRRSASAANRRIQ